MIADQDMGDCIPSKPSSSPEHVTLKQGVEVGLHLFKRKVESRRFLVSSGSATAISDHSAYRVFGPHWLDCRAGRCDPGKP
jgi:hypothetical protein